MAPKEKVTAEQKAYLLALIDDYLEVRKQADFTKFWARLFLDWFKLWPVEVDTSIKDEEERRAACGIAIKEQESYLKTWFRNRTAPKARTSHVPQELDVAKLPKATRCLQEVEIYSKKYYSTRVAHLVEDAFAGKPEPTSKELLKARRKITQDALDNETPEIKDEISAAHKEALRVRGEQKQAQKQKVEPTPECYAAGIQAIEPNFQAFAERVGLDSGWSLTLIAGGPDPMNAGRVKTASFHYGENVFGLTFSQHEPDFKDKFIPSYTNFLQTCYSPAQCSIRALNRPPGTTSPVTDGSPPASTPSEVLSPLPDIDTPPEVSVPSKATKGKAAKTGKGKAGKVFAKPTLPDANSATLPTTAIPTPQPTPTLPTVAEPTITSTTATCNQGATWEPLANDLGAGLMTSFPLLPPDLDYLNDPANFPDTFPIVSNTPMATTIPSSFTLPPLGNYMSLLDELGDPLPANLLGTGAMYATTAGTMPAALPVPYPGLPGAMYAATVGATPAALPVPYPDARLPVSLSDSVHDDAPDTREVLSNEGAGSNANDATKGAGSNANDATKGAGSNANDATKGAGSNANDATKGAGSNANDATKGAGSNANDATNEGVASNAPGAVPEPSARIPRKRRCDEIDPKFIVDGKRVRKQQVRTEIEALTHKGAVEKGNNLPKSK